MLSTSILSYCNKLLDDDLLRNEHGRFGNGSRHGSHLSTSGRFRVRYMGAVRSAKTTSNTRKPLKSGIASLQKPLTELYSSVQRQLTFHRHYPPVEPGNFLLQTINVCSYGVVISECDRFGQDIECDQQPVVTKVITPLSNILLYAALRFHPRRVKGRRRSVEAAFVPLACSEAVLDNSSFIRLSPKQRFLLHINHPPVFLCMLRNVTNPKILECHMFAVGSDEDAVNLCTVMSEIQSAQSKVGALAVPPPGHLLPSYSYSKSVVTSANSNSNARASPESRTRSSDSELPKRSMVSTSATTTSPNSSKESRAKRRYRKYKLPKTAAVGGDFAPSAHHRLLDRPRPPLAQPNCRHHTSVLSSNNNNESELSAWRARSYYSPSSNAAAVRRTSRKRAPPAKADHFESAAVNLRMKPITGPVRDCCCSCDSCCAELLNGKINLVERPAAGAGMVKQTNQRNWNRRGGSSSAFLSALSSSNDRSQSESNPESSGSNRNHHRSHHSHPPAPLNHNADDEPNRSHGNYRTAVNYEAKPSQNRRRPVAVSRTAATAAAVLPSAGHHHHKRVHTKRSLTRRRRLGHGSLTNGSGHRRHQIIAAPLLEPDIDYTDNESSSAEDDCICCAKRINETAVGLPAAAIQHHNYNGYLVAVDETHELSKEVSSDASVRPPPAPPSLKEQRPTMVLSKTVELSSETDIGSSDQSALPTPAQSRPDRMLGYGGDSQLLRSHQHHQLLLKNVERGLAARAAAMSPASAQNEISLMPNQDDLLMRSRYPIGSNFEELALPVVIAVPPQRKKKKPSFLTRWLRIFRRKRKQERINRSLSAEYRRYDEIGLSSQATDSCSQDSGNAHGDEQSGHSSAGRLGASPAMLIGHPHHLLQQHSPPQSIDSGLDQEIDGSAPNSALAASSSTAGPGPAELSAAAAARAKARKQFGRNKRTSAAGAAAIKEEPTIAVTTVTIPAASTSVPAPPAPPPPPPSATTAISGKHITPSSCWSATDMREQLGYLP